MYSDPCIPLNTSRVGPLLLVALLIIVMGMLVSFLDDVSSSFSLSIVCACPEEVGAGGNGTLPETFSPGFTTKSPIEIMYVTGMSIAHTSPLYGIEYQPCTRHHQQQQKQRKTS